jgi:hypothetical protein
LDVPFEHQMLWSPEPLWSPGPSMFANSPQVPSEPPLPRAFAGEVGSPARPLNP